VYVVLDHLLYVVNQSDFPQLDIDEP
jgi:hypothetical protein